MLHASHPISTPRRRGFLLAGLLAWAMLVSLVRGTAADATVKSDDKEIQAVKQAAQEATKTFFPQA